VSKHRIARYARFVARIRRVLQCISDFFALREHLDPEKDSNFSRKKLHDPRKILLVSARCRTRQFLPSTILMDATEILHVWRVELCRRCAQMMPQGL
jgi:hypothetical protein